MSCGALGCVLRCAKAREEGEERPSLCPGGGYPNGWPGGEGVPGAPTFSAGTAAILSEGRWQIRGRVLLVKWYERRRLWIVEFRSCEQEVWRLQQVSPSDIICDCHTSPRRSKMGS